MLKAVAQGKSGSLLKRRTQNDFDLKHRPQEDLVTSAIFGSLELLSETERRKALEILVGENIWKAFRPDVEPITVELWPPGLTDTDESIVEPDVVLSAGDRLAIVEVKWFSHLSEDQLGREVRALQKTRKVEVNAILLLGGAVLPENIGLDADCCDALTWRDVAKAIPQIRDRPSDALGAWMRLVADFLEKTEFGRIFRGFESLEAAPVRLEAYEFRAPGGPPWFAGAVNQIRSSSYEWKGRFQ